MDTEIKLIGPRRQDDMKPLWDAALTIEHESRFGGSDQARTVFLQNRPQDGRHWPAARLVRCRIDTLTVRLPGRGELVLSLTGNTGGVVSLMIQNPGDGDPSTVAYLLHGDIPLDLVWHEQEWAAHPPVIAGFSDVAFIRLTADGLSFAATGTVPWVDTPLAARYLLRCPFDSKGIGLKDYEVRIDLRDPAPDRFVPPENTLATFAAVFQKLRSFLARTEIAAPAWQELLLSSESIPPFSWRLSGTKAEFHLDAGALQLHLSDRPASIEPGGKYPRQVSAIECKWRVTRDKGLGTLRIEALGPTPNGPRATWNWSPKDGDSISLQEVLAADDALQTALFVRQGLGTRRPDPPSSEQLRRVYRAPVLYAFMPIEDGWTQWPVPNLVREDYASTGSKIVAPATSHSAISGAIVYQSIPGPDLASAQNPWKISVLRADQIANSSAWEIDLLSSPAAVKSASTCLLAPTLELDGFLWLSARRPTVEDAIPDLADHLRHLRSVPIRSGVVTDYPGAFTITIKELKVTFPKPSKEATPSIALWEMSLGANALFAVRAKPFVDVYGSVEVLPPLRLQRHPSLPFVQCLPLFQLQDPASYPAASRELAVFNRDWNTKFDNEGWIPTKRAWRFKFWGTGWPKAEGTDPVVPDWDPSLPLGSLSLPGLTIGPQQNAALPSAALGLSAQYWHGLPYLDQVHAFSQLPPKDDDDDGERQDPAGKTTGTARNRRQLDRNSLGDWWRDLSSRQFFARIESAECLSGTKGALKVDTLIEPYPWPVDATLDESYPGQFTLTDLDTKVAMPLKRELALRGLHGSFSAAASTIKLNNTVIEPASDFPVVAGSMISATQSGRKFIQDQRGLSRRSSTVVRDHGFDSYIDTPLEYRGKSYIQRTLLKPLTLQCADKTWRLLIAGVVLSDGILFERSAAQSAVAEDVNDPAARGADYSFLAGYSWWLDDGSAKTSLKLCGLDLFPLALDRVEFKVSGEVEIRLMARLQLPTFTPRSDKSLEQTQRSNAVVLTFKGPVGYDLQLDSIVPAPASGAPTPAGEWPLNADETGPLISWNQISYAGGKITVAEGRLEFGLFGQNWEIALPSIVFEAGKEALFVADVGYANVGIEVLKATGALRQGGDHNIELRTRFHWGDDLRLSLELGFPLRSGSTVAQPTCTFGSAGGAIPLECSPQITPNLGIQSTLSFGGKLPASVQLLPGMAFAAEDIVRAVTSGFAAAVFTAGEAKPYGDHLIPVLTTTAGSAELILPMQWGSALQDAEIGKKAASSLVFSSSAGDLVVNYSAQLATGAWKAQLLLSGWIEVKNLISWPESIVSAPDPGDLAGVSAFELYFPEGDDHLPAGSEEVFKNIGEQLATNRYWVRIEGHASDTGSARSNFTISQRRAGAVEYGLRLFVQTNYKSDAGWMLRKIEAHKAYGENRLAVLAYDADARKANRRVTIHLYPVSVRLPVATETLNHDRHTARILFNQHVLDAALTTAAPVGSNIIASLGDKPWNTTAVVQHEIVRVRDLTQKDALLSGRRRWTVAQEIRLASPQTLAAALDDLSGDKVQDPMSASSVGVGTAFQWTLSSNWLNKAGGGNALRALTPGLILEASVPVWLRIPASDQDGLSPADPCILQYLPTGTMRGSLLDPSDFRDARQGKRPWLFLSLPFLGRLQPADQDNSKLSVLNMDPVQTVMALGSSAGEVVLGLVSRRPVRPVWAYLHRFEGADHRRFERLTESVLEEGLRRYLHPAGETVAAEGGFAPVMATVPESNSGLVTRPTALAAAFVPRRTQYPVEAKVQSEEKIESGDSIAWGSSAWFGQQAAVSYDENPPLPAGHAKPITGLSQSFFFPALLIRELWLVPETAFLAATALPVGSEDLEFNNQPASIAVSPCSSLAFSSAKLDGREEIVVAFGECLAVAVDSSGIGTLKSILSTVWIAPGKDLDGFATRWAREAGSALAPESAVLIVRIRCTVKLTTTNTVVTQFRHIIADTVAPGQIEPPGRRLRSDFRRIHFTEAQFSGLRQPVSVRSFEMAPPYTTTVQPVWTTNLATEALNSPAGLSALRLSYRTIDPKGPAVVGPHDITKASADKAIIWWQSVWHHAAFATNPSRPVQPKGFRAPARLGDAPAPAQLASADGRDLAVMLSDGGEPWQPVLPQETDVIVFGARPGAPLLMRPTTIVHSDPLSAGAGALTIGASVPVQHRYPRPIPLPANRATDVERCHQPWAALTMPEKNHLEDPVNLPDIAAFDLPDNQQYLQAELVAILQESQSPELTDEPFEISHRAGLVIAGRKTFACELALNTEKGAIEPDGGGHPTRPIAAAVTNGSQSFALELSFIPESKLWRAEASNPESRAAVSGWIAQQSHGTEINLEVTVPPLGCKVTGYNQVLRLPLQVCAENRLRASAERQLVHFEDPAYNRVLASAPAQKLGVLLDRTTGTGVLRSAMLSVDRREYNSSSIILGVIADAADPTAIAAVENVAAASSILVAHSATFSGDLGVFNLTDGKPMTRSASKPKDGEYRVDFLRGSYSFSDGDAAAAKSLQISYNYKAISNFQAYLQLCLVDSETGLPTPLDIDAKIKHPHLNEIFQIELGKVTRAGKPVTLSPADSLFVQVWSAEGKGPFIEVPIRIVSRPVTPPPDHAYALLASQFEAASGKRLGTRCVRFAWSPFPDRVELIDPDDLLRNTVRRRAVFRWLDSVIPDPLRQVEHAVQKITPSGSTHWPAG